MYHGQEAGNLLEFRTRHEGERSDSCIGERAYQATGLLPRDDLFPIPIDAFGADREHQAGKPSPSGVQSPPQLIPQGLRFGSVRWIASEDLETTLEVLCDQLNDCGFAHYADRPRGI